MHELHAARPNTSNTEALERIGASHKIEEAIRGEPPDERWVYQQSTPGRCLKSSYVAECRTGNALARIRREPGNSLCAASVGCVYTQL
ncbi:hypothetical protein FCJ57_22865 [Burkholderia diffusa]|nr:hypothetical protein [Burkholderia diffusa]